MQNQAQDPQARAPGLRTALYAMAIGGCCGALLALIAAFAVFYDYGQNQLAQPDHAAMASIERQSAEIDQAFIDLAKIDAPPCSPEHLAAMRVVVFHSSTIRDAAYRQSDTLLCSSGLGTIVTTLPVLGPPDFVAPDGRQIWRNVILPVAPGLRSGIVRQGHYSLLVAPGQHPTSTSSGIPLSAVLVNRLTGTVKTIQGPPVKLEARMLTDGARYRAGTRLVSVACIATGVLCYVKTVGTPEVLRDYALPITLIVVGGGALGWTATLVGIVIRRRRATLDSRLRRALAKHELSLEYQPIFDVFAVRVAGAEALMRWTLPSGDRILPTEFIAAAEESPLITELTCLAVETVSRDLHGLLSRDADFVVSINIVPRDLTDPRFIQALDQHIVGAGIQPDRIAFELTERQSVTTLAAMAAVHRLSAQGYKFYIDDFGTGYSNLSYLSDLPIDKIKLDRIFTQSVGTDTVRSRLVPAILDIASGLNVPVIVEGVETTDQARYFQGLGVHLLQGWLYSRSVVPDRLVEMATSENPGETTAA